VVGFLEGEGVEVVFTSKADRDLPILTQFYQLEVPGPVEEKEAIGSGFSPFELRALLATVSDSEVLVWTEVQRVTYDIPLESWPADLSNSVHLARFEGLLSIHDSLCDLMRCEADGTYPLYGHVAIINEWLGRTVTPPWIVWGSEGQSRVEHSHLDGWQRAIEFPLAVEFINAFQFKTLVRCDECRNVFPKGGRSKHFFCSHRCGDRVSKRRTRSALSDDK
jgi:hypothetical protein